MGREWYFNWGAKSFSKKRGVVGGGRGGCSDGKRGERKPAAPPVAVAAAAAATAGGCMNAVLHMFDFHQLQLCLHPHDNAAAPDHAPTSPKVNSGLEAPRNSLESFDDNINEPPSLASIMKDEKIDSSHVLASRRDTKLKVVQAPRTKMEDLSSSESSSSPAGARTPNLVARLMGLEILPESTTTTPRSSTCQPLRSPHVSSTPPTRKIRTKSSYYDSNKNVNNAGSHSLPETPRPSSLSRRRSTDFIDQHRLSLQVTKENSIIKEMQLSRPSCSAISTKKKDGKSCYYYENECKSPGYYARQIMRQVKESVSRRVGVDITNIVEQRDKEIRRDEHLLAVNKHKKPNPSKTKSKSMCSDLENQLSISEEMISKPVHVKSPLEENQQKKIENEEQKQKQLCSDNNKQCLKKLPLKSLDSIRNKKDEQFVRPSMRANNGSSDKKCKRMPLSSELFHGSVPSFVPFKKDTPSTSQAKLMDKMGSSSKAQPLKGPTSASASTSTMARLSKVPSQGYLQKEVMHTPAGQGDKRSKDTSSIMEFQYISRILKCTGIDRDTPVSFTRWFSPSHPLDPSIFYNLETSHYLNLSDPSSHNKGFTSFYRKLIFHLVDEILADLLKPYIEIKPWAFITCQGQNSHFTHQQQKLQIKGFQLVKTLCTKIRSFPSTNCQTLQDIDALVEKDLPKSGAQNNWVAIEEEGEAIVFEIERDIVNSLVQEIAMISLGSHSRSMQRYVTTIRI